MVSSSSGIQCPFCGTNIAADVEGRSVIRRAARLKSDQHGTFLTCPACSRPVMLEPVQGGFRISEFQNRSEWG